MSSATDWDNNASLRAGAPGRTIIADTKTTIIVIVRTVSGDYLALVCE